MNLFYILGTTPVDFYTPFIN